MRMRDIVGDSILSEVSFDSDIVNWEIFQLDSDPDHDKNRSFIHDVFDTYKAFVGDTDNYTKPISQLSSEVLSNGKSRSLQLYREQAHTDVNISMGDPTMTMLQLMYEYFRGRYINDLNKQYRYGDGLPT